MSKTWSLALSLKITIFSLSVSIAFKVPAPFKKTEYVLKSGVFIEYIVEWPYPPINKMESSIIVTLNKKI